MRAFQGLEQKWKRSGTGIIERLRRSIEIQKGFGPGQDTPNKIRQFWPNGLVFVQPTRILMVQSVNDESEGIGAHGSKGVLKNLLLVIVVGRPVGFEACLLAGKIIQPVIDFFA